MLLNSFVLAHYGKGENVNDNKSPGTTKRRDSIGDALTKRQLLVHLAVDVARHALRDEQVGAPHTITNLAYHVNGNRPLGKYAVPTILKIEAPAGFRVSPVVYPRATVRRFSFSEEQLAVYENRAVMRFNVTVPAGYKADNAELRVRLRYQSCNNEACFPPVTREATLPLQIVGVNEAVKRTNNTLFGGGSTKHARHR